MEKDDPKSVFTTMAEGMEMFLDLRSTTALYHIFWSKALTLYGLYACTAAFQFFATECDWRVDIVWLIEKVI